jgi:hypothetical protein
MNENVPLAGSVKNQAKEGFERLLLAPVFLVYEIVAVLFPGVLFILILIAKGNHSVISAFQNPLLGYKTKLAASLIVGYLIGKIFCIPETSLRQYQSQKYFKMLQTADSKHLKEAAKKFIGGAFLLPGIFGSEHVLDYMVLSLMNVAFEVTTGVMLIVSSLIPGDPFRWFEAVIGAVLIIRGYRGYEGYFGIVVSMLGVSLSSGVQKLFSGDAMSGFVMAMKIISGQVPTPAQTPSAAPAPDAQSVTEPTKT